MELDVMSLYTGPWSYKYQRRKALGTATGSRLVSSLSQCVEIRKPYLRAPFLPFQLRFNAQR